MESTIGKRQDNRISFVERTITANVLSNLSSVSGGGVSFVKAELKEVPETGNWEVH
jgi:hypothetical protein